MNNEKGTIYGDPLVTSQVTSSAESISTILNSFSKDNVCIPEYQRDSDQWSDEKKSLFIDSIMNNLTVPSFIYAHSNDKKNKSWTNILEVVDGQQRLILLNDFYLDQFKILPSGTMDYISPNALHYANKKFSELPEMFKELFENYKITIIYLPECMTESVKLETFRRLNQQPFTLSAQDIRLSQYAYSKISNFIRISGISDLNKHGSKRMLEYAKKYNIEWPWVNDNEKEGWIEWWNKKKTSIGQKASEMVLWYIIGLYHSEINNILSDHNHLAKNLNMSFINSIDNVADIALAQLNYEEKSAMPTTLCTIDDIENNLFPKFMKWHNYFYVNFPSTFNVQRYRLISFIFSALHNYEPFMLQQKHNEMIDKLISKPRETSIELGINYPETKGKWSSNKGLHQQIKSIHSMVLKIMG
ncbi:DUF262 domain-containing protein [Desulfonatronum thioautotrophicum]|uniref:DUF262 domain-containing protein n=1 Tax=Desulfonatronum thioautotrophicum TaxID=617001 RepID=UPI000699471E|nr:DUF262 domain-containing protein [Desulfonatronum thioautotrophicum]